jgi:hypothetical protein
LEGTGFLISAREERLSQGVGGVESLASTAGGGRLELPVSPRSNARLRARARGQGQGREHGHACPHISLPPGAWPCPLPRAWLEWSGRRNRTAAVSDLASGCAGWRPVGRPVCRRRGRVVCRAGWLVRSAARLAAFSPASRLCPPCELFACHRERVGGRDLPARRPLLSSPVRAGRLARMARTRRSRLVFASLRQCS